MATLRDVAQRAGVSSTTVSHVINATRPVSSEVRERVNQAIQETGYRTNALARSLRRGQTHTLGLVLPDIANPFFAETGREIELAAFAAGYNIILCNTENDAEKESLYVKILVEKQVDGLIFVGTGDRRDSLEDLPAQGIPVVTVDRDLSHSLLDSVLCDNHGGGWLATRHLVGLGHRRIACISGPSELATSCERVAGYRDALLSAGLPQEASLVLEGDFHPESAWACARSLLDRPDRPTAIFACNDLMAIGVLRAAHERGLRVPEDLSVVGFDDIELASYAMPPLTTIGQPKGEIGRSAVAFLLARIGDKEISRNRKVHSPSLLIRKSSAPPSLLPPPGVQP